MKQIQPRPLDERVQWVNEGRSAYLEYATSAIRNLAEMPIADYLARFEEARARLCVLLSLPDCSGLTYQETACRIHRLHRKNSRAAGEAACILANPMKYYYDHCVKGEGGA